MFEVKRVIVGQERLVERLVVACSPRATACSRACPGVAKTLAVETLARTVSRHVLAAAVHPRPRPVRHRRHPHLPGRRRELRHRARPDHGQLRPRRRDQPGAGEGAVGAARGDGRAARDDRRPALRRAAAVPRARHAEPDRVRGRLPAARGAARPLPDEDRRRLPERRRGARDHLPDGRRRRRSRTPCSAPTTCCACRPPRQPRLRAPRDRRLRRARSCSPRARRSSTASTTSRSGCPTAPARAPASA